MFENIVNFFKKLKKNDKGIDSKSKETAKERLHLVCKIEQMYQQIS